MQPNQQPSLSSQLRERLQEQAYATTLRATAAAIGMDHTGLHRFLAGGNLKSNVLDIVFAYYETQVSEPAALCFQYDCGVGVS